MERTKEKKNEMIKKNKKEEQKRDYRHNFRRLHLKFRGASSPPKSPRIVLVRCVFLQRNRRCSLGDMKRVSSGSPGVTMENGLVCAKLAAPQQSLFVFSAGCRRQFLSSPGLGFVEYFRFCVYDVHVSAHVLQFNAALDPLEF